MSGETALLTFGIGPVHTFIVQARRVADVWAGSYVLSHLIRQAIALVRDTSGCTMVFPYLPTREIPDALPNRFVCRVPAAEADTIAKKMRDEVRRVWNVAVKTADRKYLEKYGLSPDPKIWNPKTPDEEAARFLDVSWSWVPERGGYAWASTEGARRYAASRMFRPFLRSDETGEKCAICGERTALPNGDRDKVRRAWMTAEKKAEEEGGDKDLARYLRLDQGRLCLVCAVKRLFPIAEGRQASFLAFDRFQPSEGEPRFALVMMDGDRMGSILSRGGDEVHGDLEGFHREVSEVLSRFAGSLRQGGSVDLNLGTLGYTAIDQDKAPQLIYAGGDDVLFICDPREAIPLTRKIRDLYLRSFDKARSLLRAPEKSFTISAAILFAHPAHPAGLLLRDLEELLETEAKERAGRDAVAIRLAKRSGAPVDVVLPWEDAEAPGEGWMSTLEKLTARLQEGALSSRQTFTLRLEEKTLRGVFKNDPERWRPWLADRLSRNEGTGGQAKELAELVTPFFVHDRTGALRIARFLGREAER